LPCDGCAQAANLRLKFVAHIGEVATQTIKRRRKLVGIDVILVHRLLKNPVQAPEYVLFSEELYRTGQAALPGDIHEVSQDLEGIGPVHAYFVNIEDLAGLLPPLPDPPGSDASGGPLTSSAAACRTCWACGAAPYRFRLLIPPLQLVGVGTSPGLSALTVRHLLAQLRLGLRHHREPGPRPQPSPIVLYNAESGRSTTSRQSGSLRSAPVGSRNRIPLRNSIAPGGFEPPTSRL
jgi:uncharacterized protein DUF2652